MSQQDTSGPGARAASPPPQRSHGARPPAAPLPVRVASRLKHLPARSLAREAAVLAGFLAAGVAVTWPRASYITGRLPLSEDQSQYVWSLWWVARQITRFGNPWFTTHLAAPVGVQLGYDTLMPLLGAVMAPVTLVFGPFVSYNLVAIVQPGLAAYVMYRAARLWLPSRAGAIAAGAFFGMSGMLASQDWLHMHTAVGCLFLPVALEAAIRLRRGPTVGRGILLGLAVGASVLVDPEAAVMAGILAALVLIPWLLRGPGGPGLRAVAAGVVTAAVTASPQIAAMAQATGQGGTPPPPIIDYVEYAAELPSLFAPSPRLARDGITGVSVYSAHTSQELVATFGVVLTVMAVSGLIVSWRRHGSRKLALLWLGSAALALGPTLDAGNRQYVPLARSWHGLRVSLVMPYTWLIQIPGLSAFREADRLALLGLTGAALLAGAAVEWLGRHARPVIIVVAALGALEAGWPGNLGQPPVPTALPALDRPIAADHSGSIVVDVPFIIRGPRMYGDPASFYALALATADGHPRAVSNTSGVPLRTIRGIRRHAFYSGLVAAQRGRRVTHAHLTAARRDLRTLDVGWVLVWTERWTVPGGHTPGRVRHDGRIRRYLGETGFRFAYRADGVFVYRPSRRGGSAGRLARSISETPGREAVGR